MTKTEAQKKARQINDETENRLCPLSRKNCSINCVCYYCTEVFKILSKKEYWGIRGGYCTAYCLTGPN